MLRIGRGRRPQTAMLVAVLAVTSACAEDPEEHEPRGGPAPVATQRSNGTTSDAPATDEALVSEDPAPVTSELPVSSDEVQVLGPVATGLDTPWDVDFLSDGSALVPLRDQGLVLHLTEGETVTLDAGGPGRAVPGVEHGVEDGLLGLAVGPDDAIYLYLTTESDNRVVRYRLEGDTLLDAQVILAGIPTYENHVGGRIAFGPDGFLYITTGDTRDLELPQDPDSLAGKILRVTSDGAPAPGNPFGNEVWSMGHRNVQGIGWTSDGRMYASEFGSSDYDELNLIEPGADYGWPQIEGWAGDPDFVDPLVTWTTDEASPSGIAVTDDGVWMTALRGERLWFVPLGPDGSVGEPQEHLLGLGRLRAVTWAPDGTLWIVTSNTDGRGEPGDLDDQILRLEVP